MNSFGAPKGSESEEMTRPWNPGKDLRQITALDKVMQATARGENDYSAA